MVDKPNEPIERSVIQSVNSSGRAKTKLQQEGERRRSLPDSSIDGTRVKEADQEHNSIPPAPVSLLSPLESEVVHKPKRSRWGEKPAAPSKHSQWEKPGEPPELFNPTPIIFDNPFKELASLKQTSSAVKAPVRHSSSAMTPQTKGEKSIPEHLKELQIAFESLRVKALQHNKEENLKEIDRKFNGGQFFKKCNELNSIFPDKEFHSHLKKLVDTACAVQKNGARFTNADFKDKKDYKIRNDLSKARHDFALVKRDFEKEILRVVGTQERMKKR